MNRHTRFRDALRAAALGLACVLATGAALADGQPGFSSAQEAVDAAVAALEANDATRLVALLGPGSEDIVDTGDPVSNAAARTNFLEHYKARHALVAGDAGSMTLTVGDNDWPLPVPVVQRDGKWYLDGAAGADELVYRRIGRNELGAIGVCHGFVDAQIEYAEEPRDGNAEAGVYAARLFSDEGRQDGLYWPTTDAEPMSPAGPAMADAAAEGYRAITGKRTPYHGYFYRMLFAQDASANGGAMEYFDGGKLVRGVALLAWPAHYGLSGVKSFMVNQDGVVYEQDLGEHTDVTVQAIDSFDPGAGWSAVKVDEDD